MGLQILAGIQQRRQVTQDLTPDRLDVYQLDSADPSLPKIVYACQEAGEFLYGTRMGWQPTMLHPNELMDGAIYRTFNGPASVKDATYFFQNHPVIEDLYSRHGRELNFLGVLLYPLGDEKIVEKERITSYATKLLKMIEADGAVISWIGGGHLAVDFMLLCRKCEQLGIKTALLSPEMATTPEDPGFVHYVSEADAIVSTGNYEREITLPPVERVIGGTNLVVTNLDAAGSLTVTIRHLYGATSPLGQTRLMGVQY
ncbi:MAG: glycine/sarcosine/betaine reductase component B subunit [Dehalococcoidia bacterium]